MFVVYIYLNKFTQIVGIWLVGEDQSDAQGLG